MLTHHWKSLPQNCTSPPHPHMIKPIGTPQISSQTPWVYLIYVDSPIVSTLYCPPRSACPLDWITPKVHLRLCESHIWTLLTDHWIYVQLIGAHRGQTFWFTSYAPCQTGIVSSVCPITSPHRCPFLMTNDGFTRPPHVHPNSLCLSHSHSLSSALFGVLFFLHPFQFPHIWPLSMHGDNALFIASHLLFAFLYPPHQQHCLVWLWDCKECKIPDWNPSTPLYFSNLQGCFRDNAEI